MENKACTKCGKENNRAYSYCKKCVQSYNKEYRKNNITTLAAKQKERDKIRNKKNTARRKLIDKKKHIKNVVLLSDKYVKYLIRKDLNLTSVDIPIELVELKRIQLKITRELRK